MDKQQLINNTCRQIEDIVDKAEALKTAKYFLEELDNFSEYNEEMKKFISERFPTPKIIKLVNDIPTFTKKKSMGFLSRFLYGDRYTSTHGVDMEQDAIKGSLDIVEHKYSLIYKEINPENTEW